MDNRVRRPLVQTFDIFVACEFKGKHILNESTVPLIKPHIGWMQGLCGHANVMEFFLWACCLRLQEAALGLGNEHGDVQL